MSKKTETPLMQQYNRIKGKYPDALLLFRVGDFYETFGQDAVETAKTLGITLTKRHNGSASEVELAGFPHHALDMYLHKLVRAGYRVAVCDQLENPALAKTVVKRGVTELVTPGLALGEKMLDHKTNNYLASVFFTKTETGVAFTDISTGEFLVSQGNPDYIDKLLQSFAPAEVILPKTKQKEFTERFGDKLYLYPVDDWVFGRDYARETLLRHFQTQSLKGFGVDDLEEGIIAAGAVIHYLSETEHPNLQHITALGRLRQDKYMWLDRFTIRNLELLSTPFESGKPLISVLDKTVTPMGSRLLKKWMVLPLLDKQAIIERLAIVQHIIDNPDFADALLHCLKPMGDLERLIALVPMGRVNPRQVAHIKKALQAIAPLQENCLQCSNEHLNKLGEQLNPCKLITEKLDKWLSDDPPVALNKGGIIAEGVSEELDELRHIQTSGKDYLLQMEQREIANTGISSLKIGFNNVFGYYFEVRNKYKDQIPAGWIRKQTLTGAERYISEELKRYEEKILGAEEKTIQLETALFNTLTAELADYIRPIQLNANLIARIDCLLSFAAVAQKQHYCCPQINTEFTLNIKQGRHPVIEQQLQLGETYVPNDIELDSEERQILIITGPNMSGKSALLRQTALIVLMAQMGSFVPAQSAEIGLIDKIFTRVGASDNISSGESTFMVEMNETASIMNNLSPRSLILLDEIGRGTSTYDGISIAWALAEFLHNNPKAQPKTLFATHYHELTELAEKHNRIKNYSIAVKETGNKVIFLRKLVEGPAEKSFGIHVAQMAGMPKAVVTRAIEILAQLEKQHQLQHTQNALKQMPKQEPFQLSLFEMTDPKLKKVKELLSLLNINALTPIEALLKLQELKNAVED
ncbi:DNA mismatch repair protein MutS [Sphingobacteriales bacterium UPWRP_1]|nr:DNA mismatch repair protein MutS [Sphingobacteriales bacterium TSM_CSM]PSJ72400.1 DNA mismatch repair protein MutS [Sphingobacteriales bacterium UPWRP_1]